jgi:hypothetical protein
MSGDVQPLRRLRRLRLIAGVMPNWYETAIARQETGIGSMVLRPNAVPPRCIAERRGKQEHGVKPFVLISACQSSLDLADEEHNHFRDHDQRGRYRWPIPPNRSSSR